MVLAASLVLIVATQHSSGEANVQQPERTRIKVLRRKDRLHLKPTAQEIQNDQPQPPERLLEDKIPKNVPIKIKIRKEKEKAFKDTKNEKWADDFELEVTNTGTKPIYYLYLLMVTEVRASGGYRIVFPLTFGKTELGNFRERAGEEDIRIAPGDSTILKIHPGQLAGYGKRQREENRPHPKKMTIKLEILSFGDGTGYFGNDAQELPRQRNQESRLGNCVKPPNTDGREPLNADTLQWGRLSTLSFTKIPASFTPVNFFLR